MKVGVTSDLLRTVLPMEKSVVVSSSSETHSSFIASGSLGAFIAITRLIGALANSSRATEVPEILKGLAIDIAAVLSNLKLRVDEMKIIPMSSLRGIARLVICAGPASFVTESFKRSEPYTESLLDRGVLVVPLVTDGISPAFEFEETGELATRRKRLWQLPPVYISEGSVYVRRWLILR
ncbi:uncharacterized protein HKW66_Vig0229790 [Vigna angularis]|uniref:Uncharacterized protein n=1 Tax=Phaseolus angularis TaxID=3914 RepID=A0A8T0KAR4_PHAAN|nr:uncharacterized protein HKW66_Vig0229790 [Vigna angularis]